MSRAYKQMQLAAAGYVRVNPHAEICANCADASKAELGANCNRHGCYVNRTGWCTEFKQRYAAGTAEGKKA